MQILIIRHALAEDRETFARRDQDDDLRPLTKKGRTRMKRNAMGLTRLANIDLVGHSPLVRAVQTAGIIGEAYPGARVMEVPELAPGRGPETVAHWLGFVSRDATLAMVGHEPDLGELVAWFCTGVAAPFMHLKKGSAVMLRCERPGGPGCAELEWAVTPRQLRLLANCS